MEELLIDEKAIAPALLLRELRDEDIKCPAGERVGDAGCFCNLERGVIDGRTSTASIGAFCMSQEGYKECPTWRAEKQRLWDLRDTRKSLLDKPKVNKGTPQQRRDRLQAAQARMLGDSSEAKKFRRRLGLDW